METLVSYLVPFLGLQPLALAGGVLGFLRQQWNWRVVFWLGMIAGIFIGVPLLVHRFLAPLYFHWQLSIDDVKHSAHDDKHICLRGANAPQYVFFSFHHGWVCVMGARQVYGGARRLSSRCGQGQGLPAHARD